jgi:hypothetical protein
MRGAVRLDRLPGVRQDVRAPRVVRHHGLSVAVHELAGIPGRSEMDHGVELLAMIEALLAGRTTIADFEERFYWYYLEQVPDGALSEAERSLVESICERMDSTAGVPDPESRRHGWIDHAQFLEWLRAHYREYTARDIE